MHYVHLNMRLKSPILLIEIQIVKNELINKEKEKYNY